MGFLCSSESVISTCNPLKQTKKKKKNKHYPIFKLRRFSYADLEAATNGFSPRNLLGKGSHGAVFFATLDGRAAAVKVPTTSSSLSAENEIEILSAIRSRRIVNLIGYAVDYSRERKLILVVEYMPNGSINDLLHTNPHPPAWSNRVRFALQIAKAVQTLHCSKPPVIHRDIKSCNVLIDQRWRARVSDFGLAVMGKVDELREMSTPPAGTLGYLDPCYLTPENLSRKSDVFSFGILLLEIVSGRHAIDVEFCPSSIVEWALPLIESGEFRRICDRRIRWPSDQTVIRELALLAVRCVRSTAEKRPSMDEVVDCLERIDKGARKMCIWNRLRRRVMRVESYWPLDESDGGDGEEHRRIHRRESRRSLGVRKVSDVPSLEGSFDWIEHDETTRGIHQMARSKTMSTVGEIEVGPDGCASGMVKRRSHAIGVKVSTVKLGKSKSMGELHGSKKGNSLR